MTCPVTVTEVGTPGSAPSELGFPPDDRLMPPEGKTPTKHTLGAGIPPMNLSTRGIKMLPTVQVLGTHTIGVTSPPVTPPFRDRPGIVPSCHLPPTVALPVSLQPDPTGQCHCRLPNVSPPFSSLDHSAADGQTYHPLPLTISP